MSVSSTIASMQMTKRYLISLKRDDKGVYQRCADGGRVRGLTPVRRDFANPRTSADGIWREFAVADAIADG